MTTMHTIGDHVAFALSATEYAIAASSHHIGVARTDLAAGYVEGRKRHRAHFTAKLAALKAQREQPLPPAVEVAQKAPARRAKSQLVTA